jgi:hypothetical protein
METFIKYKNFFTQKVFLNRNVNKFKEMTTERIKFCFLLRRIYTALRRCYRQTDRVSQMLNIFNTTLFSSASHNPQAGMGLRGPNF